MPPLLSSPTHRFILRFKDTRVRRVTRHSAVPPRPEDRSSDPHAAMVTRLRTVMAMTNDLLACPDLDSTFYLAVEAIRNALDVERCAIYIARDGFLHGTYGTDLQRRTTDERTNIIPISEIWQQRIDRLNPEDAQWIVTEDDLQTEWDGEQVVRLGQGWIAITPIQAVGGFKGLLFNDTAITGTPLDPVQQEIISVFCSLLGRIIENKEVEGNIRQALAAEKELGELKNRFISTISHEFRTPMATIQSSAELLKYYGSRMDDEKKQAHLDKIENQIEDMTSLLTSVLTISRADTVGLPYEAAPLDILHFATTIIEEIRLTFGKAHQIELSHSGECPVYHLDQKLLRQIVTNLLTNAVKYSPTGSRVSFQVWCEAEKLVIRVQDEGIGIPKEDMKHLFHDFHRAGNVEAIPGTGLGLAIVKRAVQAHGGSIGVESILGTGTTFTVTFPVLQTVATPA